MQGDRAPPFSKIDFNGLVLSKNLRTKSAFLAYVQAHGTASMNAFAAKHQRKLDDFIEDAIEWESAPATAAAEEMTDWVLLCVAAVRG